MQTQTKRTKMAKDLRSGDVIVSGGIEYAVKRVHGPTRADWNHTRIYFRKGGSSMVSSTTEMTIKND